MNSLTIQAGEGVIGSILANNDAVPAILTIGGALGINAGPALSGTTAVISNVNLQGLFKVQTVSISGSTKSLISAVTINSASKCFYAATDKVTVSADPDTADIGAVTIRATTILNGVVVTANGAIGSVTVSGEAQPCAALIVTGNVDVLANSKTIGSVALTDTERINGSLSVRSVTGDISAFVLSGRVGSEVHIEQSFTLATTIGSVGTIPSASIGPLGKVGGTFLLDSQVGGIGDVQLFGGSGGVRFENTATIVVNGTTTRLAFASIRSPFRSFRRIVLT